MADSKEDDLDDGLSGISDFVQIYLISIDLIGATNLEKADTFGKSDPFCKISAFSTSYTTCTIRKTLNPKWNEHVEMTFFNDPKQLKFEVFDYDGNTKDDPIGDCMLNLDSNIYDPSNNGFSGKIKLENAKSGEIEIKVIARKLVPSELEKKLSDLQNEVETNNNNIEELDLTINDWNNKNSSSQNEIDKTNANIINLKDVEIPNAEKELKQTEDEGEELKNEESKTEQDIDGLKGEYDTLEKEENDLDKKLEDVRISEDKKNTENEHLRKDINDLKEQIKDRKEREEKERREREEKERKEKDDRDRTEKEKEKEREKEKEKKEEEEDVRVEPTKGGDAGSNDSSEPLVKRDNKKADDQSSGCNCCVIL